MPRRNRMKIRKQHSKVDRKIAQRTGWRVAHLHGRKSVQERRAA